MKVFVDVVKQIKVGKDSKAFYGSLISKVQFDKVLSYIEAGKSEAKLECGGEPGGHQSSGWGADDKPWP